MSIYTETLTSYVSRWISCRTFSATIRMPPSPPNATTGHFSRSGSRSQNAYVPPDPFAVANSMNESKKPSFHDGDSNGGPSRKRIRKPWEKSYEDEDANAISFFKSMGAAFPYLAKNSSAASLSPAAGSGAFMAEGSGAFPAAGSGASGKYHFFSFSETSFSDSLARRSGLSNVLVCSWPAVPAFP